MVFVHVLFALFFAVTFTAILAGIFGMRGPWGSIALLFAVIFLVTWAGGLWLSPLGPGLYGSYWLPFLLAGLFISLILAAAVAPPPREKLATREEARRVEDRAALGALGLFFWVLMGALIVAIAYRYWV
jgi:hypothetical protein